jgi:hypothetical protein
MSCQYVSPIRSTRKEKLLPNIDGLRIIGSNSHSSPWLVPMIQLTKRGYHTYRRAQYTYMTYITTYPSSGAHAFNASWIALHTSQECIHVLKKRPQDIPRSPCPRCMIVASPTIDTQPLPHDRDCSQANLILS